MSSFSLHLACINGDVEQIRSLLNLGADIEEKTPDGSTPLMFASYKGHLNVVQLLLDQGANILAKNNYGNTAKYIADNDNENIKVILE